MMRIVKITWIATGWIATGLAVSSFGPYAANAALIESASRTGAGWQPIVFPLHGENTIVTIVDVICVAPGTASAPPVAPAFVLAPRGGCSAPPPPALPAESIPIHRVIGTIYKLGDHDLCASAESEDIDCTVKGEPEF